ncbi:AP2/ERF domain-containing protein [Artemisia annua]|uniref:AP2/ERF domain-containing protein n=1 Tax=Artemisia annua TaxID=35608 RepID=A0A2U1Q9T5_ARTAN|nr:AP2/ERF domain-containing protein [Artemisia annua]
MVRKRQEFEGEEGENSGNNEVSWDQAMNGAMTNEPLIGGAIRARKRLRARNGANVGNGANVENGDFGALMPIAHSFQHHQQFQDSSSHFQDSNFNQILDIPDATSDNATNYSNYTSDSFSASYEHGSKDTVIDDFRGVDHSFIVDEPKVEGNEEIDLGLTDLLFVDNIGSSMNYSPFDIAEEITKENYNEADPSMLSEATKRMKFERNISASLYAFNGISECLRMKENPKPEHLSNLGPKNEVANLAVDKLSESKDTLVSMESFSSSSSKEVDESFLWSSFDLPSLDMFFSGSD